MSGLYRTLLWPGGSGFGFVLKGGVMPTAIDRHRVQQLLAAGAQLVEVLPPPEFLDEHLPGAISIPLKELDREGVRDLDRDRPVIVYCYDDP